MDSNLLKTVPTPAAVVDLERLKRNTESMASRAHALGVRLRPHVKTHKCVAAAKLQVDGHFGGITVSTLAEVEHFCAAGFSDITYAVPLAPGKAARAWALHTRLDAFQVLVDDPRSVEALEAAAPRGATAINVLIKVDCGYGRAGLLPESADLVTLAEKIYSSRSLKMVGVLAHGGHSYDCTNRDEIRIVAEEERSETVKAAERIRRAGIPVDVVSVGSTPTACVATGLDGITELRPGNYALFDVFQSEIGSCRLDEIALSVVTEVIGVYPERGELLIDAGALALSKDPGAAHVTESAEFGRVCALDGRLRDDLRLVGLSQEHGKIRAVLPAVGTLPAVGERLRILPNHSCLVTALHHELHVEHAGRIIDRWHPARGW